MTTQKRTWKEYAEELKADVDRAVARNSELADQLEAANARIEILEKETAVIPGLRQGVRDARDKVEAALIAVRQRQANLELEKRLQERGAELGTVRRELVAKQKELEELAKANPPSDQPATSASPPATQKEVQLLAQTFNKKNGETTTSESEEKPKE